MILTQEQLDTIEKYAAAFMSPGEIAVVLGLDIKALSKEIKTEGTPAFHSYHKAKIEQKFVLREKIIKMASFGSNSAEQLVESYIIEQTRKERDGRV